MRAPLNRTSAPQIVRFFDVCFKQGVLTACEYSDDYGARDFLIVHKNNWDFGVLGEPDDFDWEMWRFTLYRWARQNHMKQLSENYIYRIAQKNYLWYFLPYCMRFYLMGVEEWLSYPNPSAIELFKAESRIHWIPQKNTSLRKMTQNDFISYMQEFCYEFRRIPLEERKMSLTALEGYCQAIHDLTRKYDTGRKITILED